MSLPAHATAFPGHFFHGGKAACPLQKSLGAASEAQTLDRLVCQRSSGADQFYL